MTLLRHVIFTTGDNDKDRVQYYTFGLNLDI